MHKATGSTNYRDRHQVVDSLADVKTVFREAMNKGVFKQKLGRNAASQYKDLIADGLLKTATKAPVAAYKNQARENWQRGQLLPGGEYAADDDEDVDEDNIQADRAASNDE